MTLRFERHAEPHLPPDAAAVADADSIRFTRFPSRGVDEPYLRAWLDSYALGRLDGTREGFAVFADDGAFVGVALAPQIDEDAGEIELAYIVTPVARGHGVATEVLLRLTDWALGSAPPSACTSSWTWRTARR